jgi:hypothetical protein
LPLSPARQFFEHQLPARAAAEVGRLFASEGSIAFKVDDAAWTFRFGDVEPVVARFDRDAPLQLWFTAASFSALLDGSLDIGAAVTAGSVKARGQLSLLENFGRFLQDDKAALGWDAGG